MPVPARLVRALVLMVVVSMASGAESLAIPVAHLFADHHHEITFSPASGSWQWVAVAGHRRETATLSVRHHGHDHQVRLVAVPLRTSSVSGLSPAVSTAVPIDPNHARPAASCRDWPELAPDVGKPDLALLSTMRV